MKKLDEYLKIAEAARFLGVSVNTLRKWADDGRIPMRVNEANRYRLFVVKDLERFLEKQRNQSAESGRRNRCAGKQSILESGVRDLSWTYSTFTAI